MLDTGLDCLRVEAIIGSTAESVHHGSESINIDAQRRRLAEASQHGVPLLRTIHSIQWWDTSPFAVIDIGGAGVTGIAQELPLPPQLFLMPFQRGQHRRDLLTVVPACLTKLATMSMLSVSAAVCSL